MNRRDFLKGSVAAISALTVLPAWMQARAQKDVWLTGYGDTNGGYGAAFIDEDLNTTPVLSTRLRLHDVLVSPNGKDIVAPARRPGDMLWAMREGGEVLEISAPEDRHFYGHATYSHSGDELFITENDFNGERGVVGIYDARDNFKRIGEFSSQGIGPHELHITPDAKHIIMANGGILTHPETGRAKLNLDSMDPNLAMIDAKSGKVVERVAMPDDLYQLSMRHFAMTQDGEVVFGVQDQQRPYGERPMVGAWRPGEDIRFFDQPAPGWTPFNGYIGSVAIDQSGRWAAAASPRGGVVAVWDIASGKVVASNHEDDICGVAPTPRAGEFLASSGQGKLIMLGVGDGLQVLKTSQAEIRFDNHCRLM